MDLGNIDSKMFYEEEISKMIDDGRKLNIKLSEYYKYFEGINDNSTYLFYAFVLSLLLSEQYLKPDVDVDDLFIFIDDYLINPKDLKKDDPDLKEFARNPARLFVVLGSFYRLLQNESKIISSIDIFNLKEMKFLQNEFVSEIYRNKNKLMYNELGAWLTYAPFKVILLVNTDWWNTKNIARGIDDIILPAGVQVVSAVKKIKKKFGICEKVQLFASRNSDNLAKYPETVEIHECVKDFIKNFNANNKSHWTALDFNTALYIYGSS